MFILVKPGGVAFLTCPLWGPVHSSVFFFLFPFKRMLDPLDLWSTNLRETFSRNLNGPDCVTSDLTSAGTGKKKEKRKKTSIAALLKYFLSLVNMNEFGSVLSAN